MLRERFPKKSLEKEDLEKLKELGRICRGDILKMTTLANSGHPGGSMSSVDIYLILYSYARVSHEEPFHPLRDRIVVSHGHTSPGVYSVLGRLGFLDIDEVISGFRRIGSIYEGHIVRELPGIEWSTGNLGQGLAAGCGMAVAARERGEDWMVFVAMSDGEQTKGQVGEARRFARKFNLGNLVGIIDYNDIQISGFVHEVMPQRIKENYEADGWKVWEVDGHDYQALYEAIREAIEDRENPGVVIARTVIGKGVSFMENKWEWHGKALPLDLYRKAMEELGLEDDLERYRKLRESFSSKVNLRPEDPPFHISVGKPVTYSSGEKLDNRTAFGKALLNIKEINQKEKNASPLVVFDCDLASSVKTDYFWGKFPENFYQCGVQEHSTATIAGAVTTQGVIAVFADFGVFGVDETFNQHRLNDMNHTHLKLVCTHCGVDVGQDGKTHQCIDYLGVFRNLFGYKVIVPADPNQTDRVIRYILPQKGNWFVAMGRSKQPVILKEDGSPFFDENYQFVYGKADLLRDGKMGSLLCMGPVVWRGIRIWERLKEKGIDIQVWNVSSPLSLDEEMLKKAVDTGLIITYEDHHVGTGLGSLVGEALVSRGKAVKFLKKGLTYYGESALPEDLYRSFGLDVDSMVAFIEEEIKKS